MVFYLSCTGNTLWAAKQLADVTNEKIVSIAEVLNGDCRFALSEGERVGVCFPVHGWKLQPIIKEFICKLSFTHAPSYVYTLCTCGDSCGETMKQISVALAAKGLNVKAECSLVMPESYIGLPFMDVDSDLREAEKKSLAAIQLRKFSEIVLYRRDISLPLEVGYLPKVYSRIFGPFFHRYLVNDKRFRVDTEKCNGCGKCAKVCPVANMQIIDGHPEWMHTDRCLTCFACYHYCPQRAIDFWHFTTKKGQYYYEHNKVSRKER